MQFMLNSKQLDLIIIYDSIRCPWQLFRVLIARNWNNLFMNVNSFLPKNELIE